MNNLLKGIAYVIYRYHGYILIIAAIFAVLSMILISKIELKTDIMDVLPANNPSMNLFSETMDDLGRMNALTVVLETSGSDIEKHIDIIDVLSHGFSESPLVKDVDYSLLNVSWDFIMKNFPLYLDERDIVTLRERLSPEGMMSQIGRNYRKLSSPFSSIAEIKLISEDPLDIRSLMISKVSKGTSAPMDFSTGYYISDDHSLALIFVTPNGSSRNITFVKSLQKEIDAIIERTLKAYDNPHDIKVGFAGVYAVSWEMQRSLRYDIFSSALITIVLVILIFIFIYRSVIIVIPVIFLTLFVAIVYTFSFTYIFLGGLNLVTALVTVMLIGLGIDYTLHIYDRYVLEFKRTADVYLAIKTTLVNTGKSVVTSGMTTAIAFFSIVVTDFMGLHELGIVAGIGILFCMVSTIVVMGAGLVWISMKNKQCILSQKNNYFLENTAYDFIVRHDKVMLICLGVVLLISILGLGKIRFISDVSSIGLKNSNAISLQERLTDMFDKKTNPFVVTYRGDNNLHEVFDELEKRIRLWEGNNIIGDHSSLGDIVPPPYRQKIIIERLRDISVNKANLEEAFTSALNKYNVKITGKHISYIRGIYEAIKADKPIELNQFPAVGNRKAEIYYNKHKRLFAAYIYPKDKQWSQEQMEIIKKDTESMGNGWHVTGWQILSGELKDSIIKDSILAAIISLLFIIVIIYLHFKSFDMIVLAQVPLLSAFIITLGIMGHGNIEFNYINIAAIAMLFGFGVDYGVYVMQALSENSPTYEKSIMRHAFKNIVICSLTTTAGFGSLVTTNFRGIASLGLVIIIGIVSCLAVSTAILPLSENIWKRKNERF